MRPLKGSPRYFFIGGAVLAALAIGGALLDRSAESVSAGPADSSSLAATTSTEPRDWTDRFGDGWPDAARLDDPSDRENFTRWLTYLAESVYYQPAPPALAEVNDCAALIRYAYRNALAAHTAAWRQSAGLRVAPGFGDLSKFDYPDWPLGRGLFRTAPGPFAPEDLEGGVFQEFADAQTLLRYNSFAVSRDLRAARAGDLLFFRQPEQSEPFHVMVFVGHSHFQPEGADWLVYHTGEVDGQGGEVRHVRAGVLAEHPEPRWRPLEANLRFLGVYRFNILR